MYRKDAPACFEEREMKIIKTLIYSLYALMMPTAFDGYGREI